MWDVNINGNQQKLYGKLLLRKNYNGYCVINFGNEFLCPVILQTDNLKSAVKFAKDQTNTKRIYCEYIKIEVTP